MLKRNLPLIAWLIFVIYVLYGTFIPFDLSCQGDDIANNLKRANYMPFYYGGRGLHIPDVLSNLLLFIPYGFLLYLGLQRQCIERKKTGLIIISSVLFSSIIEFLQLFSPSRTSSTTDIINNTIGTVIGCILGHSFLRTWKNKFFEQLKGIRQKNPLLVFLILYSLLIGPGFMFPFDISIDVGDIKHALKRANLMPFDEYNLSFINMGLNVFPFVIFGFIGYAALRIYSSKSIFNTIFLGVCLATLIEFCQIFIVSRMFDITGIILRVIGILFGVLISVINYYRK